ncbi:MAG: Transcriptional regulator, IclR [Propionibacteriaceae bacterium]|nr:Transcriptional regulator, IclR [Propionibacteriaceae bacterium]
MSVDVGQRRALVGSVLRAMRLLDLFDRGRPEMSLAEFARRSGYSKSTTYRLLVTLVEAGWLERSPAGAFRLTIKAFQVGSILVDSLELRREAGPIMARIATELNQAVYLVVAAGTRAVCLERIDTGEGVRMADLYVGGSQPLNLGGGPRALLAFDQPRLLPPLLEEGLTRKTESSLADPADLLSDLAETRRRGYSISDEDVTAGIGAIGAPILGPDGVAVAALSFGGLRQHVLPPRPAHVACLLEACQEISTRLGYSQLGDLPAAENYLTPNTAPMAD